MKIGPAGYTIAPARAIAVTGPFFPWQRQYELKKQERVNAPWFNQQVISDTNVGLRLFTMEPLKESFWFELDVQPLGTAVFGPNVTIPEAAPTLDGVASAPPLLKTWTPAKLLVTYYLASGQTRQFRCDIGNGITIAVPCTNKVDCDLLVWSEEGLDTIPAPFPQGDVLRNQVNFATIVSCKATAVHSPNPVARPRWTQLVWLDGSQAAGTLGAQIPLVEQVGKVRALANSAIAAPLAIGDVNVFYHTELQTLAQGVAVDAISTAFPTFPIDFLTPNNSRLIEVPRPHANVVRVNTQNQDVRANVAVIQELFS